MNKFYPQKTRTVIAYGTFDLLHIGHRRLLERAKHLGDKLIVGVTSDEYDKFRGKYNVKESTLDRIENVKGLDIADCIIIEEYEGQKIDDIAKYNVDTFVVGSDWAGQFDYLKQYCDVVYLERTKDISSTQIRNKFKTLRLGVAGCGRVSHRFVAESRYVSGVEISSVFSRNMESVNKFILQHEINNGTDEFSALLDGVDAVYIATPHATHYHYAREALLAGKHVICEKPIVLKLNELESLESIASSEKLVLMEAIKTAYAPAFKRCVNIAKSGKIGNIIKVSASFSKISPPFSRELTSSEDGGSMTELGTYPLFAIFSLLGFEYKQLEFVSLHNNCVDIFTDMRCVYDNAVATGTVALGGKTEGDLIISGTKGYVYVPAPWWKTEYFEVRFEDMSKNEKYYYKFHDEGFRYELSYFINAINSGASHDLSMSKNIVSTLEKFMSGENIITIS